ncbi:MAG: O-antigen ligase family protein [Synechococcus sp.]
MVTPKYNSTESPPLEVSSIYQDKPSIFAHYLAKFEEIFSIYCLLFYAGGFTLAVRHTLGLPLSYGDPITTLMNVLTLLITIVLVALRYKLILRTLPHGWIVWAVFGVCLLSVIWSQDRASSLDQLLTFLMMTTFALYFAARFHLRKQLYCIAWMASIILLGSLFFVIAVPSYGVMGLADVLNPQDIQHTGAWRGIFVHKNHLGRALGFCTIIFFLKAKERGKWNWIFWFFWVLAGLASIGSASKTAMGLFFVLSLIISIIATLRWKFVLSLPMWMSTILLSFGMVVVLFYGFEVILESLGRDATLSGRMDLWLASITQISNKPFLGHGFQAFWRPDSGPMLRVWSTIGFSVGSAHNGFIELAIDLGLLGLFIFAISFFVCTVRSVLLILSSRDPSGLYPLSFLVFMITANLSESSLVQPGFIWVLYVSIYLTVSKQVSLLTAFPDLARKS